MSKASPNPPTSDDDSDNYEEKIFKANISHRIGMSRDDLDDSQVGVVDKYLKEAIHKEDKEEKLRQLVTLYLSVMSLPVSGLRRNTFHIHNMNE